MKSFSLRTLLIYLTIIISFLIDLKTYSQSNADFLIPHRADNWVFGDGTILSFNDGNTTIDTVNGFLFPNTTSAISDAEGNLTLFTDGESLWDKNFDTICTGLPGNNFASQSSLILPKPGSNDIYYVFTVDMYVPPVFNDGINYSIINYDGINDAEIIIKNEHLLSSNAQKIAAVKHQNNKDYWIVTHGFGEETGRNFYSFLLTEDGLDVNPIVTTIGHPHMGNLSSNNGAGAMKISPDGNKLALVIPDDGYVEVYDFDTNTGKISNLISSNFGQFSYANGIEFSPDNSKLYFTITPLGEGINYLYQVNLEDEHPFASPFIVQQFDVEQVGSADSLFAGMQLAVDGKIYVSKFKRGVNSMAYLGVINNPNRLGANCNYNYKDNQHNNGVYLNGGGSLMGLSNIVSSYLDISPFFYSGQCFKDTTQIIIRNTANIDSVNWDFNGAEGEIPGGDAYSPQFVFPEVGSYEIALQEYSGSDVYEFNSFINIYPLPDVNIAATDTVYIPINSSITLDAGIWDSYKWLPGGSTERFLEVSAEGLYTVEVSDINCCKNTDSVQIVFITSITENKLIADNISVFPNPAKDYLNVELTASKRSITIEIRNISGELLYNEKNIDDVNVLKKLDVSDYPNGIYIIKIQNGEGVFCSKFIK